MFVVKRRACLAKILEHPAFFFTRCTFVLWLMPAKVQSFRNRTFGGAPPPRNKGSLGCGFSGMILLM